MRLFGKTILWGLLLLFCLTGQMQAQETDTTKAFFKNVYQDWLGKTQDSAYIANYNNEITGRIIGVRKFNFFQIKDWDSDASIFYQPDAKMSIGVGITDRWFSLDVTFKSGLAKDRVEGTSAFDFQGNIFSPKQYIGLAYKYYFGYYLSHSKNLSNPIPDSVRERTDIRSSYFGLEYFHAFNYGRFSFKAPFMYNEVQKKSAGSFVIGADLVSFIVDGDYALVPVEVQGDLDPNLSFESLNSIQLGINFGYMHSFVFYNHFFVTLGAFPGLVLTGGDYKVDQREFFSITPSLTFKTMNAMGFNARRFYGGLQASGDIFGIRLDKKLGVQVGHTKIKFYVGYRFNRK